MRDPERIDTVLAEVRRIWVHYPDLRLGQLISNVVHYAVDDRTRTDGEHARAIFNLEEDALLRGIAKMEQRLSSIHSRQED